MFTFTKKFLNLHANSYANIFANNYTNGMTRLVNCIRPDGTLIYADKFCTPSYVFTYPSSFDSKNGTMIYDSDINSHIMVHPCNPMLTNCYESYLMDNHDSPISFARIPKKSVVIGYNQCAYAELNLTNIANNDILICRRTTGGGAVYLDEKQILFGIVGNNKKVSRDAFIDVIVKFIKKKFGYDAIPTGKNDISVDGKK
jgi:hypothetical protein